MHFCFEYRKGMIDLRIRILMEPNITRAQRKNETQEHNNDSTIPTEIVVILPSL
jgi:hypothetical protein